jgi:hypothetical protein
MTSERQLAANRLDPQRSSGPRTDEGKERSSRNALTHGLTARTMLLAGEDADELSRLRAALIAWFGPQNVPEQQLIERIVSVSWRLRRIPAAEAALLQWLEACLRNHSSFRRDGPALSGDKHRGLPLAGRSGLFWDPA